MQQLQSDTEAQQLLRMIGMHPGWEAEVVDDNIHIHTPSGRILIVQGAHRVNPGPDETIGAVYPEYAQ
jgi:hypothetical protein